MVALVNISDYPSFGFEHKLLVGNPYFITILKQSFKLAENGKLIELPEQIDIRLHDIVKEDARWDSVRYPSDMIPHKPKPEIILNGIAQSATHRDKWVCGIDLKQGTTEENFNQWSKHILVTGERYWECMDSKSWNLTPIQPTTKVSLSYEQAYGGRFLFPDLDNKETLEIQYPYNPSGSGWLVSKDFLQNFPDDTIKAFNKHLDNVDILPAPQLFALDDQYANFKELTIPNEPTEVAGFGSYTNFWQMRTQYLAEDLDWSEDSAYGGYPVDFDMRHWQQAPADQWLDFKLKGQEVLTLTGFFPEGEQSYTLPTSIAYVVVRDPEQLAMKLDMDIDTLIIDTEHRTLEIIWRRIVLLTDFGPDTIIQCNAFISNNFRRK